MIGEMRDLETAQIGVQAALTGHKVFSTLHTNDAASSITRLLDMGLEPFLLTSTVNGVIAQRLVRTLCSECKQRTPMPAELAEIAKVHIGTDAQMPEFIYEASGCSECEQIGYRGRTSIVEVLTLSNALRAAILDGTDADGVREIAIDDGMRPMFRDGLEKVLAGSTTLDEILRVTRVS